MDRRALLVISNRLIQPISEATNVKKDRLVATINSAVDEINQIHTLYDQYFTSVEGRPAISKRIEDKLEAIKNTYADLFDAPEGSLSKTKDLDRQIEAIRKFHIELTEGDAAIDLAIKNAQTKITSFYSTLFETYEEVSDGGQKAKLDAAFSTIIDFESTLNKESEGYKAKIEKAKTEILTAYAELFDKDTETQTSRIDQLKTQIEEVGAFHGRVEKEFTPFIEGKQKNIDKISADIAIKQNEIDNLLSVSTVRTLLQGYSDAMQIYGSPVYDKAPKGSWEKCWHGTKCLFKAASQLTKFLGSYLLFVGPLVVIGWLFVTDGDSLLNITQDGNVTFSGTEYIAYKLTIALPLLWVSWYGQKSIAHRKRLFEEYNHKLRVMQMYLQFITNTDAYTLNKESRTTLEKTVLDTISKNPSEVYGKDETLLDKLIGLIKFSKSSKQPRKKPSPSPTPNPLAPRPN